MDDARPLPDTDAATDRRPGVWTERAAVVLLLGVVFLSLLVVLGA